VTIGTSWSTRIDGDSAICVSVPAATAVLTVKFVAPFTLGLLAAGTFLAGQQQPAFHTRTDVIAVDVQVLIPGKQSNGTVQPRVVWASSVANAQVEAQYAARSTVDGFLWELSKLKDKEKAAVKTK